MTTAIRQRILTRKAQVRIEKRADGQEEIIGYAAVFYDQNDPIGTQYDLGYGMIERIMPGAFDRTIREAQDVRGLVNHDDNLLLGRTASGTMSLAVDSIGLRYAILYNPADPDHVSAREKLNRKDLDGSSFGFSLNPLGQKWSDVGDVSYCDIFDVERTYDVGPVTFPAYTGTSAGLRSDGEGNIEQLKKEREESRSTSPAANAARTLALVNARARVIEIESDSTAKSG